MLGRFHIIAALAAVLTSSFAHAQTGKPGDLTGFGTPVKPIGDPAKWESPGDYPAEARRNGWQGKTYYTLNVSASGKPEQCTVTLTSGYPLLDNLTCAYLMERAQFTPKQTGAGFNVASIYPNYRQWNYSDDLRTQMSGISTVISIEQGAVRNCHLTSFGKRAPDDDYRLCDLSRSEGALTKVVGSNWRIYKTMAFRNIYYSDSELKRNSGNLAKAIKKRLDASYAQRIVMLEAKLTVTPEGRVIACKNGTYRGGPFRGVDSCKQIMETKTPQFQPLASNAGNRVVTHLFDVVLN